MVNGLEFANPAVLNRMLWGIKKQEENSEGLGGVGIAILNRVMKGGVTEKVTFDKNSAVHKGVRHSDVLGQCIG